MTRATLTVFFFILFAAFQPAFSQHQHEQTEQSEDQNMQHEDHRMTTEEQPQISETDFKTGITLQQLEQLAVKNNPTVAQAEATLRAARGRLQQSGLYPNPVIGYIAEELAFRNPGSTSEHMFFAEQEILLGGKIGKAKKVFGSELRQAEILNEAQKTILLNAVRAAYYQVLGSQYQVEARQRLAKLAREAVQITSELFNVGAADQPDFLEAEIEAYAAELAAAEAENERLHQWKGLAAIIGNVDLPIQNVAGSLRPEMLQQLDGNQLLGSLLEKSPQVLIAQAQLQRAEAAVALAKARRVPDLRLRGGVGYNFEQFADTNEEVGWESFIEIGIPLPIFNRNQGNIAVAHAGVDRAKQELSRVRLSLTSQFSDVLTQYKNQKLKAERYSTDLLPRARKAYQLYLNSFRRMGAAYPQVLISQRNLYQLEVEYIDSVSRASFFATQLQGFLLSNEALQAPVFVVSPEESMVTGSAASPEAAPEFLDLSGHEN
ncbi:TolC family protein [bacterium]|nr:TolC family protein [bacterium]